MKLQNINNWNNQQNAAKSLKTHDNSFEKILKNQAKTGRPDENTLPPHTPSRHEQIDGVKHMALSNTNPIKLCGLKNLVRDAFSDTGKQILDDINSLCADETGKTIDMELMDELLDLYKESL